MPTYVFVDDAYVCNKGNGKEKLPKFDREPMPQTDFLKVAKTPFLYISIAEKSAKNWGFWISHKNDTEMGISGPILTLLLPMYTNLRSRISNLKRKVVKEQRFGSAKLAKIPIFA